MVKDGLLDKSTFDEWMSKTKNPKKLPERVGHKPSKVQKVKVIK